MGHRKRHSQDASANNYYVSASCLSPKVVILTGVEQIDHAGQPAGLTSHTTNIFLASTIGTPVRQ